MSQLEETQNSIQRMQDFDTSLLPRTSELGQELSFADSVAPAEKLKNVYMRISLLALEDYPDDELVAMKNHADGDYNHFKAILDFSIEGVDKPGELKKQYIQNIINRYPPTFKKFQDIISYSACRTTDFKVIEHEARGVFQQIEDKSKTITDDLANSKEQAEEILEEIRTVASEQGVSQQAVYFKTESKNHEAEATTWFKYTLIVAGVLIAVAIAFVFLSKWSWFAPKDKYETIQLLGSKVFIFATLSYLLYQCGKNFLSHKHNAVLNKHRQNALMTFKAMSDAGRTEECKEIILAQASYCMFSPQDTGYIKVVPGDQGMRTFIESIPKAAMKIDT